MRLRQAVILAVLTAAAGRVAADPFTDEIRPLLKRYCFGCHGDESQAAGLSLERYATADRVVADRPLWERVLEHVKHRIMPPAKTRRQPTDEERAKLVAWLDETLHAVDCQLPPAPRPVTMRRLNRAEYDNTIRDLFGEDLHPARDFPSDDVGYGFDNIGDVLSLSPLLFEKYFDAAEAIVRRVIDATGPLGERRRIEAEEAEASGGVSAADGGRNFFSNGRITATLRLPASGLYLLRVRAYGQQAGPEVCRVAFTADGQPLQEVEVPATARRPGVYEIATPLSGGRVTVGVGFVNDYYNPEATDPNQRDRNLFVDWFEVQGPVAPQPRVLPASQTRLITARPAEPTEAAWRQAAEQVLRPFLRRAWRRPPTDLELDRLSRYVLLARQREETFEAGVQLAIQAALVSPHFLFHVEADRAADGSLTDDALASRLSYFLWSSLPDQRLFELADQGRLREPATLAAEARRLLADPKAAALTENFAGQWLQLRRLDTVTPDPDEFPGFSVELREDMRTETELFFRHVIAEDRPVLELLEANYSFLNERLARHYGVPGVTGPQFRKVIFAGPLGRQRGGVLTQASILTVTSNPTRTSPVKRGKWVLENILGTPPPDPPMNVPPLPETREAITSGSLRERMEQHRADPNCAVCHIEMDAIGFGFENYDATGAWRTRDGQFAIDPAGELPGRGRFADAADLRRLLALERELFVRCLAKKLLTYALGRGVEYDDKCTLDAICDAVRQANYRFSALVTAIVTSDPFRQNTPVGLTMDNRVR